MDKAYIKEQLIEILCKEFQAVWLIKLEDFSLEIFTSNDKKIIPQSVNTASELNRYEAARLWYIENCVVETSKDKLLTETSMDYILKMLESGESFFIEYGRLNNGTINFNQLYYDKIIQPETKKIEYVVMGFRNIDIAKKAEIDDLTGLLTRTTFFAKAEEMLKNNPDKQFDIMISDIVDFKKLNETYGVKVADDILRWEGSFLNTLICDDLIVGRYGGDQMVILGTNEAMKCVTSAQNRKEFFEAEAANNLPSINIKFGVYTDINHNRSIISSCDKAHTALNSIKHHYSKNMAYYNDDIKNHLEKQRRIEESMYDSLNNGDFKVYYQPKHDARTGKLVGAEALIRWIHPEYGFMSPADFIPLFEQNGFIVENDRYVWQRTCSNLKKWNEMGLQTVPISVNASKLTMTSDSLLTNMKESVEKNGLKPEQLHIEVTETLMTGNVGELVSRISAIRELGFKVELDDFGSGYSSLNILSTFPIDVLKLDMTFLQQFGDRKRALVLESCIDLAKKLGFKTVSEGVELAEQKDLLGELGVDMIQGYYYSKPLSESEFEAYMLDHS